MPITGSVPITGFVAPTATGDTYPSHLAQYGKGGLRTVADDTERDAIAAARREEGMEVFVIDSGIKYRLDADLTTWVDISSNILPNDVMLKSVYDPNDDGIVTNSDQLASQAPAYYLDRTNHTGSQAQSTITGLVAALAAKEATANKGVANGYAPLDAGGKIDNSYLNITPPTNYQNSWNATTNTPALADGIGTAGDTYIVGVAGTIDLGSGNISFNIGDFAIYSAGGIWEKVSAVGVGVSSWNGLTGAVTSDLDDVADSATRFAVDADMIDALGAANSPSLTNPIATMDDLLGAIVVGNSIFMPELFANGETLGDGTLRTLTSLGYTNGSAGAIWTRVNSAYTIDVTTMTIDWIACQEAMLAMEQDGYQSILFQTGRGYRFDQTVTLPKDQTAINANRRSLQWGFDFNFSRFFGNGIRIFDKYPANQTEANGLRLDYSYHFSNGTFYGGGTTSETDCAIRLGGTTHSTMTNMKAADFGISFDFQFCLETIWTQIKVEDYGLYGVRIGNGEWSGAGIDISQSNIAIFNLIRCVNGNGKTPTAGIYSNGNQNITTNAAAFEGFNGSTHHLLYDSLVSSTTKYNLIMNDSYFEGAGASRAMIRFRSNSGFIRVDGWSAQGSVANLPVFLEVEGIGMPNQAPIFVKVQNSPAYTLGYTYRQIQQHKWVVEDCVLNNDASLTNASNWDLSLAGSSIPTMYRYTPVVS